MKSTNTTVIPDEYRKRKITWQDVLNVLAVSVIGILFVLFMGGMMFRIEVFKNIFWTYLVPAGLFFLGFYIRGKVDGVYCYKVIRKKNAAIEDIKQKNLILRQKNSNLQQTNNLLIQELHRKEHELTGKNIKKLYEKTTDSEYVSNDVDEKTELGNPDSVIAFFGTSQKIQ